MKVELIVAGLLVGAFVITLASVPKSGKSPVTEGVFPVSLDNYVSDTTMDGQNLPGLRSANELLQSKWQNSRAKGRAFSRGSYGYDGRARRDLYVPTVAFSRQQPMPNTVFAGTFNLNRNETTLSFPILFDRRSNSTLVYVNETWRDFDHWLVAKEGVHL